MNKMRRKIIGPGDTTTYKLPVIKGEEGKAFYNWFNKADSMNKLITDALKIKFMIDQLQVKGSQSKTVPKIKKEIEVPKELNTVDVDDIDLELLARTVHSIKR